MFYCDDFSKAFLFFSMRLEKFFKGFETFCCRRPYLVGEESSTKLGTDPIYSLPRI